MQLGIERHFSFSTLLYEAYSLLIDPTDRLGAAVLLDDYPMGRDRLVRALVARPALLRGGHATRLHGMDSSPHSK